MTVYVEANDGRYDWIVRVGRGRGSVIKSRHRLKRKAKQRGRAIAKRRGDTLRVQSKRTGQWKTIASYD